MKKIYTILTILLFLLQTSMLMSQNQSESRPKSKFELGLGLGINYSNTYLSESSGDYNNVFLNGFGATYYGILNYCISEKVNIKTTPGFMTINNQFQNNKTIKSSFFSLPFVVEYNIWKGLSIEGGINYMLLSNLIITEKGINDTDYNDHNLYDSFLNPQLGINYEFSPRFGVNFTTQFFLKNIYTVDNIFDWKQRKYVDGLNASVTSFIVSAFYKIGL